MKEKLCKEIRSSGERQGWWGSSGVLAAVSGGGDSMALLNLLHMVYGGRIVAAHLEHGFRGDSSVRDAEFVSDYCRRIGVLCFVRHVDVMGRRITGESAEMAGRRIRYEFFAELAKQENLPFIATGHNADDVVETMAHHIFRGTGVAGLGGIAARRDIIVRPLINCARADLRQFLRESGIPWRDDETNDENHYKRNRIRNQLIPWVRANINESFERAMLGLAAESAELNCVINERAAANLSLIARDHPFALAAWDRVAAKRLSGVWLSSSLREQGARLSLPVLDRPRLNELCRLVAEPGRWRFQWAGDVEVCGDRLLIGWIPRSLLKPPDRLDVLLRLKEEIVLDWGIWRMSFALKPRDITERRKNNIWSAALPVSAESCSIAVTSVFDFNKDKKNMACVKIPWWSSYNMPIIAWRDENIDETWQPGSINYVRNDFDYVIIAKVFAHV
ncbi:MAG: tRNA lysidine(34) synthetase TilS [Synergistaceae bacterium]|nr:tRNA lysidine(34) synthetase TilS [Synergistaceae bacterium]